MTNFFLEKAGEITVNVENGAYVPDLAFILFSLMAAHTRAVGFATDEERGVALVDGRHWFLCAGSGYSNYGRRIDPN